MGRKPAPQPLMLSAATAPGEDQHLSESAHISSPTESKHSRSPRSPFRFNKKSPDLGGTPTLQVADILQQPPQQQARHLDEHPYPPISLTLQQQQQEQQQQQPYDTQPVIKDQAGPAFGHYPQPDSSPGQSHQLYYQHQQPQQNPPEGKASKSGGFFFNFGKSSSKSNDRLHTHQHSGSRGEAMSRGADPQPAVTKQSSKHSDSSYAESHTPKPVASLPSQSSVSLASSLAEHEANTGSSGKRGKPKQFTLLGRSRSIRDKDSPSPKETKEKDPAATSQPERMAEPERAYTAAPLRTAPGQPDRSFRDMMSSAVRNHSADRADRARPRDVPGQNKENIREREQPRTQPSSLRENGNSNLGGGSGGGGNGGGGGGFFGGLKSSGSRAADMISKGLFGKGGRSGSTTEREPVVDDEHYQLKVLNLPLLEQVRLTRISKRLEDSRDKTEFWMPAFPWRAIDYLNYKGTEVEGLYRVPGSGPQIKKWQRKFDEEYDVDLFAQEDLYDINIIGSMLKAWLRSLPDELFPKAAQERVARECAGAEKVPQLLIEELSNLAPFNYYLLFAITCHLSLLLAHSDKNKMDFRNLCICFQPCMKIDAFCFKFLVCDWRDCWKGCKDEGRYIEEEYMLFDQPPPRGLSTEPTRKNQPQRLEDGTALDRNVSSSDSSKHSNQAGGGGVVSGEAKSGRLKKKAVPQENGSVASTTSTISTALTIDSQREPPPRRSGDMRPLSPIKPLSPLGF